MPLSESNALSNKEKHPFIPYHSDLKEKARENRKNMSKPEQMIWGHLLRKRGTHQLKFLRQKPIDHFIVDFYCPSLLLAIEIDGDSHALQEDYDKIRTERLNDFGIHVIRYTNRDVLGNLDGVYLDLDEKIRNALEKKTQKIICVTEKTREEFERKSIPKDKLVQLYTKYNRNIDANTFVDRANNLFPKLNCGLASVVLQERLGGEVVQGMYDGDDHTFLFLNGQVVDITADQFGGPKVYVGELKPPWKRMRSVNETTDGNDSDGNPSNSPYQGRI